MERTSRCVIPNWIQDISCRSILPPPHGRDSESSTYSIKRLTTEHGKSDSNGEAMGCWGHIEQLPQEPVNGVAADVAGDSQGRIYSVVRDPKADGTFNGITPATGHIRVFDQAGAVIETRTLDGMLVGGVREGGEGAGHFTKSPHGVYIDDEESLYITEIGGNDRLQKFAVFELAR